MDEHAVADLDRDLGEVFVRAVHRVARLGTRQRATSRRRRSACASAPASCRGRRTSPGNRVCDSTFTGPAQVDPRPGPSPWRRRGAPDRRCGTRGRTREPCRWRTSRAPPWSPGGCPSSGSSSATCWLTAIAPAASALADSVIGIGQNKPVDELHAVAHAEPVVARHETSSGVNAPMPSISRSPARAN